MPTKKTKKSPKAEKTNVTELPAEENVDDVEEKVEYQDTTTPMRVSEPTIDEIKMQAVKVAKERDELFALVIGFHQDLVSMCRWQGPHLHIPSIIDAGKRQLILNALQKMEDSGYIPLENTVKERAQRK